MSERQGRLADDLAALEAQDPTVAAAAASLDEAVWRVTHPEDVANPMREVDRDGQTLSDVLLARLRWEYGDDAPWTELGSLRRLERDVRMWFADTAAEHATPETAEECEESQ